MAHYFANTRGPQDHMNTRILDSCYRAQDKGDSRNLSWRILMFMWASGPLDMAAQVCRNNRKPAHDCDGRSWESGILAGCRYMYRTWNKELKFGAVYMAHVHLKCGHVGVGT